jgi:hypothetical protein
MPHYVDQDDVRVAMLQRAFGSRVTVINAATTDCAATVESIAGCRFVLSSSLHGLVAAWALGVPCRWMQLSDGVLGNGFKFRDFYSAFGVSDTPIQLRGNERLTALQRVCKAPPSELDERKHALRTALFRLRDRLLDG